MAEPNNLGRASLLSSPSPKRSSGQNPDRRQCISVLNNPFFKQGIAVALAVALFGGPLFALANIPDDPGLVLLDVSMVLASLIFCLELVVNFLAIPSYRCSFFFLMDILGTVSMVFEISFLLGGGTVRAVLLRSARAAKLGARAGRIFKLVMCYSLLTRGAEGAEEGDKPRRFEAKVLAQRLTSSIATRVAMITISLIAFVPLLDLPIFPREDRSMQLWATNLEEAFATLNTTEVSKQMTSMVQFYDTSDYAPYAVDGWGLALSTDVPEPGRRQNEVIIEVETCLVKRLKCEGASKAAIHFNFTGANQIQALMEIVLVLMVVAIMVAMTHDLNTILSLMMVKPLEKMFGMLLQQAQELIDICSSEDDDEEDDEALRVSELETIEKTLAKLSRIAGQALNKNVISKEEMANKSEYEKAVLVDMLRTEVKEETIVPTLLQRKSVGSEYREMETRLQSWDFDTLSLDDAGLQEMVMHIFFHSDFGVASDFCDMNVFKAFYDKVKPNYQDVRYHCFAHACDVLHTVFRLSTLSIGGYWMREVEQYSLLIAALCHDMGHPGRTNPFLVESKNHLAITYNDKSPLENMHCAKVFEICTDNATDAFGKASKELYKEARKVVVATILHTDNANHFAMIKDISQVYEAHETTCEKQAEAGSTGMLTEYRDKILEPNRLLWMELFLHLADVSNPLKPFDLCKAWAMRVLDEFFDQGDEEKEKGLPVGMLNDRDKVNKPGSQHGFITFLVSPLVLQTINLFPDFVDLHVQMVTNMEKWRDEWVADVKPSDEELAKKNADIAKCRATSERLIARRKPLPKVVAPSLPRGWSWGNGRDTE